MATDQSSYKVEDVVEMLLSVSRGNLESGNIFDALSAVLHAIRLTEGEGAIMDILSNAKRKVEEERMAQTGKESDNFEEAIRKSFELITQDSVLKDQGNEDYLKFVFESGESVVCKYCNGLIPRARWEAHTSIWCPSLKRDENDED